MENHDLFVRQSKDGSHNNKRHVELVSRLVELIATHPGIGHNELKRKVTDKNQITSTKTYDKTIKELLTDKIIDYTRGKANRKHYYIYNQVVEDTIIKYDGKFDEAISEVRRLLNRIELDFPDYYAYTAFDAFSVLNEIKTRCSHLIEHHKNQVNQNLHEEDSILDYIKQCKKERRDKTVQHLWKEAEVAHKEIKKSRTETSAIITRLLEVESSQKSRLIEDLIAILRMQKENREKLVRLREAIVSWVAFLKMSPEQRRHLEVIGGSIPSPMKQE